MLYVFYHSLKKKFFFERQDILFPVFEEILGAIRYFRSLSWLTAYSWLSTTCVWFIDLHLREEEGEEEEFGDFRLVPNDNEFDSDEVSLKETK